LLPSAPIFDQAALDNSAGQSSYRRMANGWGGRREGAGRKSGSTKLALRPKISVPELARRHTHGAVRFLASVCEQGYATRKALDKNGKRITIEEPASVALRVHCAELLLERGHGRPHQAIAIGDGSSEGGKSLRDLILGAMALDDADAVVPTIEHKPVSVHEDDEDEDSELGPAPDPDEKPRRR
jgi:hypothetical protein